MSVEKEKKIKEIKNIFYVRENVYKSVVLKMPSEYRKTVMIIHPLWKFSGEIVKELISRTSADTRIILISVNQTRSETFKALITHQDRIRTNMYHCDFHSVYSIKTRILFLSRELDRLDAVIHLIPQCCNPEVTSTHFQLLMFANAANIEEFRRRLKLFFGADLKYVILKHSNLSCPEKVAKYVANVATAP